MRQNKSAPATARFQFIGRGGSTIGTVTRLPAKPHEQQLLRWRGPVRLFAWKQQVLRDFVLFSYCSYVFLGWVLPHPETKTGMTGLWCPASRVVPQHFLFPATNFM